MSGKREARTRGVVIGRTGSGEGSVRISVFTEELGLVYALAKSGREERSKLRPHLTVGTFGFFDLVQGHMGWRIVGAVRTKNAYFAFQESKEVQESSAKILSLLRQLINGEQQDTELFETVWGFFTSLESLPKELIQSAEKIAVLKTLAALGYVSKNTVPEKITSVFSHDALRETALYEKDITSAIKNGLLASGLIS